MAAEMKLGYAVLSRARWWGTRWAERGARRSVEDLWERLHVAPDYRKDDGLRPTAADRRALTVILVIRPWPSHISVHARASSQL
jgi:hypothetical protein